MSSAIKEPRPRFTAYRRPTLAMLKVRSSHKRPYKKHRNNKLISFAWFCEGANTAVMLLGHAIGVVRMATLS